MVGIRLGDELEERMAAISASLRRPKSSLIREAIEAKIEEWEDLKMVLESYQDKEKRWSLDEMIEHYGMDSEHVDD